MRNKLVLAALTALVALLITTTARILTNPLYAHDQAYKTLIELGITLPQTTLFSISIALSIALLGLYYLHTKKARTPPEALLILALSPAFITAAITEVYALIIALAALGLVLTHKSKAAILIASITCLLHPAAIVPATIYIAHLIIQKKYFQATITTLLSVAAALLSPAQTTIALQIAEIQVLAAPSILIAILAITGAALLWDQNTYPWLSALLILLAAGFVLPELRIVAALAAATLAGNALGVLRKRTWQLETIKSATLLFILLAFLFTATSQAALSARAAPQADLLQTVDILKEIAGNNPVLTLSKQEHTLQYHNIHTTQENLPDILQIRDSDLLAQHTTEFIILEENYPAPNLRFVLENSHSYVALHKASHVLWRRVR